MNRLAMVLGIALWATGCGGAERAADTTPDPSGGSENPCGANPCGGERSLYERLGGVDAIRLVVDDFVANVAADARINRFFAKTDIDQLKRHLVDQICSATGGPCEYKGRGMKETHQGMGVSEADFNALVEDLKKSLDKFKVPAKEQGELLGALAGMQPDIVEK
jgi:hemoglobin